MCRRRERQARNRAHATFRLGKPGGKVASRNRRGSSGFIGSMPDDPQAGTHLRDERTFYGHDGTYMGNGWVMQFGGGGLSQKPRSRIDFVPLKEFRKSGHVS